MNKTSFIKTYRNYSAADSYILGFTYDKNLYMIEVEEIMPRFLSVEEASRNQGENLRLRLKKKYKEQLLRKGAICVGSADDLNAEKYNKGEIFEKIVTEYFGQTWSKDTVPFWVQGDICVDNREIQIKLDSATLMNTKQISRLKGLTK